MKMLARAAFALSAFLACAIAAPAMAQTRTPASCPRADGAFIQCTPVVMVDPTTGMPFVGGLPVSAKADQRTFSLASNATLAAGACGTPILADVSAQYGWVYQFAGSTTIMLKFRGPDGSTYLTTNYTATATGSQFVPITAGASGTYLEVCNTGSASATALYTTLAN